VTHFHVAVSLHAAGVDTNVALVHLLAQVLLPALPAEGVAALQCEAAPRVYFIVADQAVPAVLTGQRHAHLGVIRRQTLIEYKAKLEFENVLFDEPVLHAVLIPTEMSRDHNKLIELHAIEVNQVVEGSGHTRIHHVRLHEAEAFFFGDGDAAGLRNKVIPVHVAIFFTPSVLLTPSVIIAPVVIVMISD